MRQTRIRLTCTELYEEVWRPPCGHSPKNLAYPTLSWQKSAANTISPFRRSDIGGERKTGYKVIQPRLPAANEGCEHLEIYIRERLRPEFEELARRVPPKIAIAPDISHPLVLRTGKLLDRGKLNQCGLVIPRKGLGKSVLNQSS